MSQPESLNSSSRSNSATQQRRRYLASLVGGGTSGSDVPPVAAADAKPFSISVSYTIPSKRQRLITPTAVGGGGNSSSSTIDDTTLNMRPATTGSLLVPTTAAAVNASDKNNNKQIILHQKPMESNNSLVPMMMMHAPQPPCRGQGRQSTTEQSQRHLSTVTRKHALGMREEDYDGSEASFMDMLMRRLKSQCERIARHGTHDDAAAEGMDDDDTWTTATPTTTTASLPDAATVLLPRFSTLMRIPLHLWMQITSYMSVVDLCRIAPVSRRIHTMVHSPLVWLSHCKRYRLTLERRTSPPQEEKKGGGGGGNHYPQQQNNYMDFVVHPKIVVQEYLILARRTLDERLVQEQETLAALEQRLNQRAEQVAPFSHGFVLEHTAIMTTTQQQSLSVVSGGGTAAHTNPQRLMSLIQRAESQLAAMHERLETWDQSKLNLTTLLQGNRDALNRQQTELQRLQRAVDARKQGAVSLGGGVSVVASTAMSLMHSGDDVVVSPAPATTTTKRASTVSMRPNRIVPAELLSTYQQQQAGATIQSASASTATKDNTTTRPLHAASAMQLERKVARVVLRAAPDLPVVVRRGVSTFSALELLTIQLRGGGGDSSSSSTASTSSSSSNANNNAAAVISARWKQFKRFFPINNDYASLCDILTDYAVEEAERDNNNNNTRVQGILIPANLAPCAAMVRRILSMSDDALEECAAL